MIVQGCREITRLDVTMQPLIKHTSSQIIDFYLYFPQRFRDLSWKSCTWNQNENYVTWIKDFWSKVYKKCQNLLFCFHVQLLKCFSLKLGTFDPGLEVGLGKFNLVISLLTSVLFLWITLEMSFSKPRQVILRFL